MSIRQLVKRTFKSFGLDISRAVSLEETRQFNPGYDLKENELNGFDRNTRRVLNIVNYTKRSNSSYSAQEFENAYHSIELGGVKFSGQRNPAERLEAVDFDFNNTTVLDIGCNQGGMIFELADRISHGIGIDFDSRMINAANRIKSHNKSRNTDFFVFDLEKENLGVIDNFLQDMKVDIIFLLSVCMWIDNWQAVIDKTHQLSDNLLFESNGTPAQQDEQEAYLKKVYGTVTMIRDSSPDDQGQKSRKLYLCKG